MLVRMAYACAEFSGIDILAYAVLDNHFHLLIHVPSPSVVPEEEVLRRVEVLYGSARADDMARRWKEYRDGTLTRLAEQELNQLRSRMGDMSQFMQILKQRFSIWYRAHHGGLAGTIWQSRFNSTVIEGESHALCAVAAYIDLNPVRARIVSDPKDYRWSSYGAACAGVTRAKRCYAKISSTVHCEKPLREFFALYRELLYCNAPDSFTREQIKEVLASHGKLSVAQMLQCRVRYVTAGGAFGSRDFIEAVFEGNRDRFGPNRHTGSRGIGICKEWDGIRLCTLRDLRLSPVTIS